MSDELRRYSDSPGQLSPNDPRISEPMDLGSESDLPLLPEFGLQPPLNPTPITPREEEPGVDDGSTPLPGLDPSYIGHMVPGTVFPIPLATGSSSSTPAGNEAISLRYAAEYQVPPRPTPKQNCPRDYVTFTAKNGSLKVIVCNGYINGKENIVRPVQDIDPQTPVTYENVALNKPFKYEGCFTHWRADGLAGVTTYGVVGRLDGKDFSNQ